MTGWLAGGSLLLALVGAGCYGGTLESEYVAAVGGDPHRGAAIVRTAGCAACHKVPGVRGAEGLVGPPLIDFGRRAFIAGRVANTPRNLVRWIHDPHDIDPETVMPRVGLDERQSRDVAAFLYTLR
jgi:cytochrome c1